MDDEVEDVMAELWAGWLGRRRRDAAGNARRSAAELTESMAEGKWRTLSEWRSRLRRPCGAW